MQVALLTPSGGRPRQLELCRKWVNRFDLSGVSGVSGVDHFVSERDLDVPRNLLACIGDAGDGYDIYAVVEDDDFYPRDYLANVVYKFWGLHNVAVGCEITTYYHVPTGGIHCQRHEGRASLNSTSFSRGALETVKKVLAEAKDNFVDIELWKAFDPNAVGWLARGPVGMKGLPGRKGAGAGHKPRFFRIKDGKLRPMLQQLVGPEWMTYFPTKWT